jgi:hypothetical protein
MDNELDRFDHLLADTCRSSLRHTINLIEDDSKKDHAGDRALEFGPHPNSTLVTRGRENAQIGLKRIFRGLSYRCWGDIEEIIHIGSLSGGTAGGALPYVVEQLEEEHLDIKEVVDGPAVPERQIAIGIWPFPHEPPRYHFNAVASLGALLGTDIDTVTICPNGAFANGATDSYNEINKTLRGWIDTLVRFQREWLTGGTGAGPARILVPFCEVNRLDRDLFSTLFDRAVAPEYAKECMRSARHIACVIHNPGQNTASRITLERVKHEFKDWCKKNQISATRDVKFYQGATDQTCIYLVAVDPFLTPIVEASIEGYETFKRRRHETEHLETDPITLWENQLTPYLRGSVFD